MPKIDLIQNLKIAQEAAKMAGYFLAGHQRSAQSIKLETAHDIKLKEDLESEKIIFDYLKEKTSFSILAEESGMMKEGKEEEYYWIVDPIDGTLNYFHYIPLCCVSIGLWRNEEPVLGVIYDFNRDEMFAGIKDQGAWLNDQNIHVSQTHEQVKAIISTGFPSNMDYSTTTLNQFVEQLQNYKKVRLFGTAALSLAYVASGKVDAYYERNIMLWDVAAGIPLILAAGGKVWIERNPNKKHCVSIYATNGRFNQEALVAQFKGCGISER